MYVFFSGKSISFAGTKAIIEIVKRKQIRNAKETDHL